MRGTRPRRRRRALITVAALVCLLVITMIGASLVRMVGAQRRLVHGEEYRLQADWLAESGLERAAARLDDDRAYRGETWSISPDELGGGSAASVTIRVVPDGPGEGRGEGAASGRRRVTVVADYPSELPRRVRSRKEATIELVAKPEERGP